MDSKSIPGWNIDKMATFLTIHIYSFEDKGNNKILESNFAAKRQRQFLRNFLSVEKEPKYKNGKHQTLLREGVKNRVSGKMKMSTCSNKGSQLDILEIPLCRPHHPHGFCPALGQEFLSWLKNTERNIHATSAISR